jgi:hypothetical protein
MITLRDLKCGQQSNIGEEVRADLPLQAAKRRKNAAQGVSPGARLGNEQAPKGRKKYCLGGVRV